MTALILPKPELDEGRFASIPVFTDEALFEACGVRIAFTTRAGGVSAGPYDSLNLGSHVNDDLASVQQNRLLLTSALAPGLSKPLDEVLIVPNQVHGDEVLTIADAGSIGQARDAAEAGVDAIIVSPCDVAALLCFADCVPVIIVLPTGRFAVVHAGWRGVENTIAAKTLSLMLEQEEKESSCSREELLASTNIYIGPYIHRECFETSEEIHALFTAKFGEDCSFDARHIDLGRALITQFVRLGIDEERICDLDLCTVCNNDRFFSYRAQDGVAGRHGAFAIRHAVA